MRQFVTRPLGRTVNMTNGAAPASSRCSISKGKSRELNGGEIKRARSAIASPPVPEPFPLPLPLPVPPAPVPGPRTSDDPSVVCVPCRGVWDAAITGTDGTWICGLGAMTGVAWLLMFLGAEAPCLGLGWTGRGGAGGGGGELVTSKTFNTLCGSVRSIFPDMCSSTNNSAAWTATTAMIAPLREPGSRSVRYATHIQRERSARVAGLTRRQTGRALGIGQARRAVQAKSAAGAALATAAVACFSAFACDLALLGWVHCREAALGTTALPWHCCNSLMDCASVTLLFAAGS